MKVAIYARYSTDLQDKTSIAGQVANCEAISSREGFHVVARFQDEGRSGNDDRRDGYQTMLEALKRGDFKAIVCDETSRITRNQAELHRLTAELRFRDQFLITADGVDTRAESSELILAVKAAIDQMEGRKIGYRTYRSLRERHKDGHSAGGKIYGYSSIEDGDYRRRIVDEEQAAIVREIFERYAAGEGVKSIARDLNERRIPSPGSYWNNKKRRAVGWVHTTLCGSHSKASGILRNPIYAGRCTWNKRKGKKVPGTGQRIQQRRPEVEWVEFQDESLRIVSDTVWNKVQARLMQSRLNAHANNKGGRPPRYLLSGLLTCASCGGSYVLRNGRAYCCSSHTNGRNSLCEQRRTLARVKVEGSLLAGIKKELLSASAIKEMSKRVRSRLRQAKRPDIAGLKRDLKLTEKQIDNVVESLSNIGTSDALTARLRQLEHDKAAIISRLATDAEPVQMVPDVGKRMRQIVKTIENLPMNPQRDDALMDKARAALRGYLGNVTVVEDGDGVFAQVELGRTCITHGAEKRT